MRRLSIFGVLAFTTLAVISMVNPGGVVIEFGLDQFPESGAASSLTVSIQKGGLDYFGRILLMVPDDCTLVPKDMHGGSFAWDEELNRAVVSWLKLPEADRFDLVFDLKTSPDALSGQRELMSEFSFIRNQDRASVTPPPFIFEVRGSHGAQANHSEFHELNSSNHQKAPPIAERTWVQSGADQIVEIVFDGLQNSGFTKLNERIPAECSFHLMTAAGGTVQIEEFGFSIVWFDGPPSGTVTYRLGQCPLSNVQDLSGALSTILDGHSIEIDVIRLGKKQTAPYQGADLVPKGPEIVFEVQIAATKNSVVTDYFKEKFNFRFTTKEVEGEFWWRYSTGVHEEYAEAKNLRNEIRENYGFHGPFVVARDDGHRITVQEALMKTGQKWTP